MSGTGKIQPGRPNEPTGPKKKKGVDSEHFKEVMKVGKVRETDPEEKKKKKQQAEIEEDAAAQTTGSPPKEDLGASPGAEPSIFTPQGGTQAGLGQESTSQAGEAPPPPPFFQPPSDDGVSYEPKERASEPSSSSSPAAPSAPKKKAEKKKKKPLESALAPHTKKAETTPPIAKEAAKAPHKKGEVQIPQIGELQEPKKKLKKEEVSPLAQGSWSKLKDEEKKQTKLEPVKAETPPIQLDIPSALIGEAPPSAPIAPLSSPFLNLPPQIQAIFERMVGVMTVMQQTGKTETTLILDSPQFKNSVFFGTQITITEFSTAPKAFNIEMRGNTQAMNLMNENTEELVAAFAAGNYNYKVHRVDASYLPSAVKAKQEAQRVKRKKSSGG